MPLVGFVTLGSNIKTHFLVAWNSEPILLIPGFDAIKLPCMLIYLAGNVLSQYVCSYSVFQVSCNFSSLTTTLVLTLRKFLSLIISVWTFNNTFTWAHWVGTVLVFGGTLIFSDVHNQILTKSTGDDKKEK